jgi:hypothetical protein
MTTHFVINDTKVGAAERAKNHWRKNPIMNDQNRQMESTVFVLSPFDKNKAMNTKAFFKALMIPPASNIHLASNLEVKERAANAGSGIAKNVTIMKMEERGNGGYYRAQDMVWRDAGSADEFDAKDTYYYLPLSGYSVIDDGITKIDNIKEFMRALERCGIDSIRTKTVYGVRKADIEFIKSQKNWVNIQTFLRNTFTKITLGDVSKFVSKSVDVHRNFRYNTDVVNKLNPNSPYIAFVNKTHRVDDSSFDRYYFEKLCSAYGGNVDFDSEVSKLEGEYAQVRSSYPLLAHVSGYLDDMNLVADYINLVDSSKGV